MKRLVILVLALGACRPGAAAGDQLATGLENYVKLAELRSVIDVEFYPIEERYRIAMAKNDEAAAAQASQEARLMLRKLEPIAKRQADAAKALIEKADAALLANPDNATALDARIRIREDFDAVLGRKSEEKDQAANIYSLVDDAARLARLRPNDADAQIRHGSALRRANRYAEARTALAPQMKSAGPNPRALAEDGLAAYGLDDFDTAVRQLEVALKDGASLPRYMRADASAALTAAREHRTRWDAERARRSSADRDNLPQVKLVTSKGDIVVELFEDDAPNTVASFVSLVDTRFYDKTKFHRVLPNFMAQGGDPNSLDGDPLNDGKGGPGYAFKDELDPGKFRYHYRGTLSMANGGPNTNGSQFFLTHRPTEMLDGKHTAFGRVVNGIEVVDALRDGDVLNEAVVIRRRDHPYRPVIEK